MFLVISWLQALVPVRTTRRRCRTRKSRRRRTGRRWRKGRSWQRPRWLEEVGGSRDQSLGVAWVTSVRDCVASFSNFNLLPTTGTSPLLIQADQRSALSFSNFNHNHQTLSADVLLVERDQSQPPAGRSFYTTGSKLRDTCWESLKFLKCYCFFSFKILLGPCLNIGAKRKSVKSGGERGCDGV